MPHEFGVEYTDTRAWKMKDAWVISEHESFEDPWPGTHRNVHIWYTLENGYAVGWNENPYRGWSFPVVKLPK